MNTILRNNHLLSRWPELAFIAVLSIALFANLAAFIDIHVWRHDSMYYVNYNDKLAEEGRWINLLAFRFLRIVPSEIAILVSFISVIAFAYAVAARVTRNVHFSIAFALLCALIPVLPVQLEVPETLLLGFVFLSFTPLIQQRLPEHYFFLTTAVVFFGTFSAFYFLMPLLYLKDLDRRGFFRITAYWVLAFVVGYIVTNLLVLLATGHLIQLASWRNPHYVTDFSSFQHNVIQVVSAIRVHADKLSEVVKPGVLVFLMVISLFASVKKYRVFGFFLALFSALGVYVSVIPVGIYVQERTILTALLALMVLIFVHDYQSRKSSLVVIFMMTLLGIRMAAVGHEGIAWYNAQNNALLNQFSLAIDAPPEETRRVYIVAEVNQAQQIAATIERNLDIRNFFSEGFGHPSYWVPALRAMGYNNFRVCPDLKGKNCEQILPFYQQGLMQTKASGFFISQRLPDGDLLIMINPGAVN